MPDNRSYYEQARAGISPTKQRSESTENEIARRDLQGTPPVSILGALIGDPGQNALIDAIRQKALETMRATGPYGRK